MRTYTVIDKMNGEPSCLDGETVDTEFVRRFTDIEVQRFLIGLGGQEQMTKSKTGIITVKSTSPDGTEVREVKFTPVSRNGVS